MGPQDPKTAIAVELGAEHPGALVDDADLQEGSAEALAMTEQAIAAHQQLADAPAGKLIAMTHYQVPGAQGFVWVPKPDISKDLEGVSDENGEVLERLGKQVWEGYDLDKRSRADWEKRSSDAMDLALQVTKETSWPWANAANVKLPLITTAAIQFHARAYPAIVPGQLIVKGLPQGEDTDGTKLERGDRIGKHMSYQVLEEMPNWEEDMDKLLLNVSIVGCAFKKTFFDRVVGANRSEMVTAKNLVVNHRTKNLTDARRITEEVMLYENDIEERMRAGTYRRTDLELKKFGDDDDPAHEFLEQHTWYDLDQDGYREPYVCVVHKESKKVVRITARFEATGVSVDEEGNVTKIAPEHYYTKFSLIPNPDGGFYDIGLGYLLNPLNETANSVINQCLDAGTLAVTGGGFIGRGLRLKSGPIRFAPGEFIPVDAKGAAIKENIVPMTFPGPSPVLFQLLGLLIDMTKDVASVKDVLSGENVPANQPATTTLALIDQGLKVFVAIYKRLHRSLGQEFTKLYRLNGLFLEPEVYFRFQDVPQEVLLADYQAGDCDIRPVTDPSVVAGPLKLIKAQALMALVGRGLNDMEIYRRYLEAIDIPNFEAILPQQDPRQAMAQIMMQELTIRRLAAELEDVEAGVDEKISKTIKNLVDAAVAQSGAAQMYAQQAGQLSESAKGGSKKGADGKAKPAGKAPGDG